MGNNNAPAIIIPAEHQSAPKRDELDKAIETAATEIVSGQFHAERDMPLDIALRAERGNPEDWTPTTAEHFQATEESLLLAEHPAVKEALARLEQQRDNARHSQEYFEKSQMLWELNENASQRNKWDGQQRWEGRENEEMRIGLILTPFQFLERLERVIGKGRVMLCRFGVADSGNPNTGRVALLIKAPQTAVKLGKNDLATLPLLMEKRALESSFTSVRDVEKSRVDMQRIAALERQIEETRRGGRPEEFKDFAQVATLQWPCSSEWMVLNFDEFGVPTTAKYLGWRTALLSMIRLGVITEKEAHKAFPVGSGPANSWYKQQLYEWRHHRVDMVN